MGCGAQQPGSACGKPHSPSRQRDFRLASQLPRGSPRRAVRTDDAPHPAALPEETWQPRMTSRTTWRRAVAMKKTELSAARLRRCASSPTLPSTLRPGFEPVLESRQAARVAPRARGGRRPRGHALGAGPRARHGSGAGLESVSSSFPAGPAPTCPPFASFSAAACCAPADWLPGTEALLVFLQKFSPPGRRRSW